MANSTTVTSKGQVTIPKHIRDRHSITAGTRLEVAERGDEIVFRKAKKKPMPAESRDPEFEAYLNKFRGTLDLGMSTDEYMELLRGE
jgi:AbrB family looped-hinge helix DNA binding protein